MEKNRSRRRNSRSRSYSRSSSGSRHNRRERRRSEEEEKKPNPEYSSNEFYLRYYVGHKGKFGHEFLEFEFKPNGRLRYANNSQYKADTLIRKEVYVNDIILNELKRIVIDSKILNYDDKNWPEPDKGGKQEMEIVCDNMHISFQTSKFGSLSEVKNSKDPNGLSVFYYLLQDIKCLVLSIISMHFRLKPT